MFRSLQIMLAMLLGLTLGGCNRSPVQTAPAPNTNTSYKPVDNVPPPQDTGVRVNADRGDVDVKVDRPGLRGDRKLEINRDAAGGVNITRDRDLSPRRDGDRPLRDRDIDIQVKPGEGVKVDLGK